MSLKISVIVPVYNVEKYLRECLDSIVTQNYDNYEVICVNDGSVDSSLEILNEYADRYEYVRVITKENGGLSSARNCGIENATGDYLYFLDSDDLLADENILSEMALYVQKDDLDILYLDGKSFYESKELYEKSPGFEKAYTSVCDYGLYETGLELFSVFAKYNDFRLQSCFQFIRKKTVDKYNLRYKKGILYEDVLFFFKSILVAKRVRHIKRIVMKRRVREGSIMQSKCTAYNVRSCLVIYKECLDYLKSIDYSRYETEIEQYMEPIVRMIREIYLFELNSEEKRKVNELDLKEYTIFKQVMEKEMPLRYVFPYDVVPEGANVIIYGAGRVGMEYYYQVKKKNIYGSIYMVDAKGNERSTDEMTVMFPQEAMKKDYDYIVIAVLNEKIAEEIRVVLNSLGVADNKIIWKAQN